MFLTNDCTSASYRNWINAFLFLVFGSFAHHLALLLTTTTTTTTYSTTKKRFTIYKVNKASKKKREKSSAKKERKATKTLAIVLGELMRKLVDFVFVFFFS